MQSHSARRTALWLLFMLLPATSHSVAWAATRILTDSDKDAKVVLHDGDQMELRLGSNPSTGYRWYVHSDSTPLMSLVSQSETQSKEPGVGRPIVQIFRFEAVKIGDGILLLRYARSPSSRSSDQPDPDEQQFDVRLTIR